MLDYISVRKERAATIKAALHKSFDKIEAVVDGVLAVKSVTFGSKVELGTMHEVLSSRTKPQI